VRSPPRLDFAAKAAAPLDQPPRFLDAAADGPVGLAERLQAPGVSLLGSEGTTLLLLTQGKEKVLAAGVIRVPR